MYAAHAPVSSPSLASSARGLPVTRENAALTASAASTRKPIASTPRRVTRPNSTPAAVTAPPAINASQMLPPRPRTP